MPLTGSIDIDRGVTIRQIVAFDKGNPYKFLPDAKYGGLTVYMYKDTPGVYYDVHGKELPEAIAALAGYPVDKLAKVRHKRQAMQAFENRLAQELALESEEEEVILKEDGDWKVIAMPMDRAKIVDKETGEAVTAVPMPKADALALLKQLAKTASDLNKVKEQADGSAQA